MAKVGFEYTVIGKLTAETDTDPATCAYTAGMYMGPNAAFNFTPNANDVKDYGDDRVVETDTSVIDGTVSIEHNEITMEQEAYILGHTIVEASNNTPAHIVSKSTDIAPYLGIGMVGKSKRSGTNMYTAKFYYKTQFREPSDENASKQDSTSFTHTTIEGNMFTLQDGSWKDSAEFDTLAAAKAWLNDKVGISEAPSVTLSRSSVTITAGETVQLTAVTNPEGETVTWASADSTTATVSAGEVEGKAAGNTVVTASITKNTKTYTAACAVNVLAAS